ELTRYSVRECDLQRSRADEAPGAEDEFRAVLLVVAEIHVIPAGYHPAFAFANGAHIHGEVSFGYAELFTSAKVRGNLRAVNATFAGRPRVVWARPADIFALDHCDALALPGKGPGGEGSSRATAKNYEVVFFEARFPQWLD